MKVTEIIFTESLAKPIRVGTQRNLLLLILQYSGFRWFKMNYLYVYMYVYYIYNTIYIILYYI